MLVKWGETFQLYLKNDHLLLVLKANLLGLRKTVSDLEPFPPTWDFNIFKISLIKAHERQSGWNMAFHKVFRDPSLSNFLVPCPRNVPLPQRPIWLLELEHSSQQKGGSGKECHTPVPWSQRLSLDLQGDQNCSFQVRLFLFHLEQVTAHRGTMNNREAMAERWASCITHTKHRTLVLWHYLCSEVIGYAQLLGKQKRCHLVKVGKMYCPCWMFHTW